MSLLYGSGTASAGGSVVGAETSSVGVGVASSIGGGRLRWLAVVRYGDDRLCRDDGSVEAVHGQRHGERPQAIVAMDWVDIGAACAITEVPTVARRCRR